jgi:hypothetical protein
MTQHTVKSGQYTVRMGHSGSIDTSNVPANGEYRVHRSVFRLSGGNEKAVYSVNSSLRARIVGPATGFSLHNK